MQKSLLAMTCILALSACSESNKHTQATSDLSKETTLTSQEVPSESARLNEWFEQKFEAETLRSPIQLTYLGRNERQGEIDDYSADATSDFIDIKKANLLELQTQFDYEKLDAKAQTSYDYWVYQTEQAIADYEFRHNGYVFDQMTAMHSFFPQLLIALHKVETAEHMQQYLQRVSASARAIDQLIELSKTNASKGVRPPYFAFEAVIVESQKIISGVQFA